MRGCSRQRRWDCLGVQWHVEHQSTWGDAGNMGGGIVDDGDDRAAQPSSFSHVAAHSDHEGVFIYGWFIS